MGLRGRIGAKMGVVTCQPATKARTWTRLTYCLHRKFARQTRVLSSTYSQTRPITTPRVYQVKPHRDTFKAARSIGSTDGMGMAQSYASDGYRRWMPKISLSNAPQRDQHLKHVFVRLRPVVEPDSQTRHIACLDQTVTSERAAAIHCHPLSAH
jgi:hypothetical protein